ncbi:acetyl-CoA C-acetyltransferase [Ochrobactrum chromiisoli]|uniref:Acetyl-CoA C-acetyltransferase n=1 Tax=Ochrobactrum chromiisoli TaxID=2993941 RepID=A0ABT3QRM3_9HYPH|nr:acetyl-CoA C-acetyltransferase [Ochrobactrum chromiisoli]MCX2698277.1 acetyl-CoA C-acetyltransferase [Ochrobactrum chromiisoli]
MTDVVIVAAARTAVGRFMGSFANTPAHQLGAAVIKALLERTNVPAENVDEVILGQVLTAGQGQNPARHATILAGLPITTTAFGINQVCGSGLRAVALAAQQIMAGDAKVVIAGGQESMSLSVHCQHLRVPAKMGAVTLVDTMLSDGLMDAFNSYHMGITAENIAKAYGISRQQQDDLALRSQQKAAAAQAEGRFDTEIVPFSIETRKGTIIINSDEYIKSDASAEKMAVLRPAFEKDGTVSAGNSSGLNDGAAALMVMSRNEAEQRDLPVLARIVSWATAGVDPELMGIGPVPASRKALAKAGWDAVELDLIEANEAFAAQACAVNEQMGWDIDRVNVNGGAIAIGHPIGASGARILVSLVHEMKRRKARKGLATLCIGGGMGVAMCLEA